MGAPHSLTFEQPSAWYEHVTEQAAGATTKPQHGTSSWSYSAWLTPRLTTLADTVDRVGSISHGRPSGEK